MSHSKTEIENFKCAAVLALGTDNAHDRCLPMQGACDEVKNSADLAEELATLKAPVNAIRIEVFNAFATGQTADRS